MQEELVIHQVLTILNKPVEEFLRDYSLLLIRSVEVIAAVTGLLLYKKYKHTAARFFIYFLVYLTFCDGFGMYADYTKGDGFLNFLEGTKFETNHCWYNITWYIGAIVFFVFYYKKVLLLKRDKNIVKYSGYIFFITSVFYMLLNFSEFFKRFFPFVNVLGTLVIIICTVLYYIQILRSEKILTFYKSLNFYISTAIFVWWLVITPLVFYDIYFGKRDESYVTLRSAIYLITNVFMYSMFTYGLIFSESDNE